MAKYKFRPRALADLNEIWDYTVKTWDEAQAQYYLNGLRDALELIVKQPGLGRQRDDLHPDLLTANYSKHVIFYLHHDWGIDVVRVLHGSRDVPQHFKDKPT